ncbi:MAG: hypothetical protein EA390_05565 [Balneolaceae bacterium]|nr:MAG: hypothetical protein EA390_05565 [Balneolaceae bacterium]
MNPSNRTPGLVLFSIALALFFIALGCGENATDPGFGNGNGDGNNGEEPGPNEVWMVGQSFSPANLEVEEGTTITWENRSGEVHTVTSGSNRNHDNLFDSGNISPGGTYFYTFDDAGTYDYFCIPHAGMTGTITVTD